MTTKTTTLTIALTVFLFVLLVPAAFGQADTSLLRSNEYAEFFGFRNRVIDYTNQILWNSSDADHDRFGNLGGESRQTHERNH